MSKNKIEWSKPPKSGGGRISPYQWFYDGLKEKPGEWAKYPGSAGGATGYAKRHDNYESTTRVVETEDGETEQQAWMMYVPDDMDVDDIEVGVEFEAADA